MLLFPFAYAIVHGVVSLLLAALVFGLPLEWPSALLALPVALLGVLAFLPFGVLIAAAVVVLKQAMAAGNFLVAGISVVAGLYFPVALLPGWIEWASEVQPFTPAVDLLRNLLVGTPLESSAWGEVAKLALFAATLIPPSVWLLHQAVRWAVGGRRSRSTREPMHGLPRSPRGLRPPAPRAALVRHGVAYGLRLTGDFPARGLWTGVGSADMRSASLEFVPQAGARRQVAGARREPLLWLPVAGVGRS